MIYPWQNTTLIGTTDLDHTASLDQEPKMTSQEVDYLFAAIDAQFPDAKLSKNDVISTYAGVRPIVLDRPLDLDVAASREKREHSVFCQPGFITVTGGKLTTFRVIANDVLAKAADALGLQKPLSEFVLFENADTPADKVGASYLAGRYGRFIKHFMAEISRSEHIGVSKMMQPIRYSKILWAELLFAVKHEQIHHLDDLLLRRTRLGNVLPLGGKDVLAEIQQLCQPHMAWSDEQWQQEIVRYLDIWQQYYSVPAEANDE
jgi:glycerol-3-phosphate dehydrogenase